MAAIGKRLPNRLGEGGSGISPCYALASRRKDEMMAFKYECSNSENAASGARGFHGKGNGKPRAKKCGYCGSAWYIEEGQWGVFVWAGGRGDYRRDDAMKLFEQPAKAEAFADEHAQDNYVVRWVWSGSA